MSTSAKCLWWGALAACLLPWAVSPAAAQSDEPAIPRVKPTATRTLKTEATDPNNPGMRYYRGGYGLPLYCFAADGKYLATQEANGNQFVLWDVAAGKNEGGFGQSQQTMALTLSPDGKKLITTGSQNGRNCTVELWDTDKRKKIADLDEGVNFTAFSSAAFAPDGKTVALAGTPVRNGQAGGIMIHFWDVTSGDEVRKINGPIAGPAQIGNRRMFRAAAVDCMAFTGDGKTLALVSDRKIILYEVATGVERAVLATLPGGRAVQPNTYNNGGPDSVAGSMAFSPDGRVLAAACTDGQVRLWDIVTGAELLPATGHKSDVRAVVFSADGKSLMSLGQDNKLLTWAVADFRKTWSIDPAKMTPKVLNGLWDDLHGEDRQALGNALRLLAETPGPSVAFLREKLKPAPAVDSTRIAELVQALHNEDFNERKKAVIELRKFGDLALPAMREQQQKVGYDEVLQQVTQGIEMKYPTPEQVQAGYAVEVLERIGTDESRKLLGELAKGAAEASITKQAQAVLDRVKDKPGDAAPAKLETLWSDLATEDAAKAFRAVRALASRPKDAAPFLRDQLKALAAADAGDEPERIGKLITELDSNDYQTRESASKELAKLGSKAEVALKRAMEGSPAPEAKRRIEALLAGLAKPKASPEQLQLGRALEALEKMGDGEARSALEAVGKDAKNRVLKEAVADSLKRAAQ